MESRQRRGGESFSCLFQLLEATYIPRLMAPSIFKACNDQSVFLTSHHSARPPLLPLQLMRTRVITLDPQSNGENPEESPHLKVS